MARFCRRAGSNGARFWGNTDMKIAIAAAALAASLVFAAAPSRAEDKANYSPAVGEDVVVYTHRFKAEDYEAGLKLTREGFTAAQSAAGQTRKNYILADPDRHEVMLISFFAKGSEVEAWHQYMGRLDILEKLAPMRSEPIQIEHFKLNAITTAP